MHPQACAAALSICATLTVPCMQIRKLALLLAMGKRVYVHCTAGINRATLTVLGYLTFVKVRPRAGHACLRRAPQHALPLRVPRL
jgi:hypothetical protein